MSLLVESGRIVMQELNTPVHQGFYFSAIPLLTQTESKERPIPFYASYSDHWIHAWIYSLFARETEIFCSFSHSLPLPGNWFLGVSISTFAERHCTVSDGHSVCVIAQFPGDILEPKKMMLQSVQVIICLGSTKTL